MRPIPPRRQQSSLPSGWRSRASLLRLQPTLASAAPAAGWDAHGYPQPETPFGLPWQGVQWSLSFVAFLAYVWTMVTYRLPVGDVAMATALLGLVLSRNALRCPPFLVAFGAFIVWAALGLMTTPFPDVVLEAVIDVVKIWLIAFVVVNVIRTPRQLRFFLFFFLAAFALYPIRGTLVNYFIVGYTVFGRALWNFVYSNPNDLAAICLLALGFNSALLITEPKGWPRNAALIGAVIVPLVIFMTQSRAALLALGMVVLIALLFFHTGRNRLRALVAIGMVGLVVLIAAPDGVWDRLSGLRGVTDTSNLAAVDEEGSAESRYAIWKVAAKLISQNPVTGVGLGAYGMAHRVAALDMDLPGGARGYRDTHSTYLNVMAETGVVGLLFFLLTVGSALWHTERARRAARSIRPQASRQLLYLQLGVLAFFLAGIFASFARISHTYLYLGVMWVMARMIMEDVHRAGGTPQQG